MFDLVLEVIPSILRVDIFLYLALGVFIGSSFGAIPGLSGILAIALCLPFTFYMRTLPAIALLLGAYKGSMFGGSVSAISFGVPGDSPAAATVFDGFPLCKKGFPNKALDIALYASITGNFIADLIVIFTLMPVARLSLKFGPRELTALMVLAMASLVLLFGGSVVRGLFAAMIGGFLAMVGTDPMTSIPRLAFGTMTLIDGIPLVPLVTGLFAVSELLIQYGQGVEEGLKSAGGMQSLMRKRSPEDRLTLREFLSCWQEILIGSGIGAFLGALPGPGATMSAFSSYGIAARRKKNKGLLGTGVVEGVAAAEAANSATVGPTLVPLLTFGVPGSGTAALFGAALILQGLSPGPGLFQDHMDLIVGVFVLMITGTAMNLIVCKIAIIPIFTRLAMIEKRILTAVLLPMMAIGIYSINLRPFDVIVMFGAGILGLALRRIRVPIAPVAVAMIVMPILEVQFRRTLILSQGNFMYFFESGIALAMYLVIVALAVYATILTRRAKKAKAS